MGYSGDGWGNRDPPDVDTEASVHAGALETEEDGEADCRDERWGGCEGDALPDAHWGFGLLQSAQVLLSVRPPSSRRVGWAGMGRVRVAVASEICADAIASARRAHGWPASHDTRPSSCAT